MGLLTDLFALGTGTGMIPTNNPAMSGLSNMANLRAMKKGGIFGKAIGVGNALGLTGKLKNLFGMGGGGGPAGPEGLMG